MAKNNESTVRWPVRDMIYVGVILAGIAMAWSTIATQQGNLIDSIKEIRSDQKEQGKIVTSMDRRLVRIETKLGVNSQPEARVVPTPFLSDLNGSLSVTVKSESAQPTQPQPTPQPTPSLLPSCPLNICL